MSAIAAATNTHKRRIDAAYAARCHPNTLATLADRQGGEYDFRKPEVWFTPRPRGERMAYDEQRVADLVELHALCARYMAYTSQFVADRWLEVFTPDVEYSAFGTPYSLERFPALLAAAPRGQFIGNMPVVEFDGD